MSYQYSVKCLCPICRTERFIQSSSKKSIERKCRRCFYDNREKSCIGTEILDSNGYIRIKIDNKNTWVYKHRYIWENINGCIPKGFVVHHKDENKTNNSIDNLQLMSKYKHDQLTAISNNLKRKHNVIPKINHPNQKDFSKHILIELIEKTKSIRATAKILGVAKNTIERNLKDYGIKIKFDRKIHTTTLYVV